MRDWNGEIIYKINRNRALGSGSLAASLTAIPRLGLGYEIWFMCHGQSAG